MATTLTSMQGITKRFPGTLANDGIDLEIAPGVVHALLGENGAGSSTLMQISGRYRPDAGEILIGGTSVRFHSPRDALRAGIGMVHQHFLLVADQTVAENVALGHETPRTILCWSRIEDEVRRLSEAYCLPLDPRARIDELSLGQQQRVEILKLLYRQTDILILDEPTAVLSPGEIDDLFAALRRIAREGRSVIFITHKLEEVMEIADRITILRRGRRVADLTPAEVENRRELARLMVGRRSSSRSTGRRFRSARPSSNCGTAPSSMRAGAAPFSTRASPSAGARSSPSWGWPETGSATSWRPSPDRGRSPRGSS